MTTANRLTTAGMGWAAGKGVTGACVGAADHVACAHCITRAGGHGNTSTYRVARTGATTFRCTFIGLHDVHFLIRNFDVHRIQNPGIPIGFPIFLQTIVGSVLHFLTPLTLDSFSTTECHGRTRKKEFPVTSK